MPAKLRERGLKKKKNLSSCHWHNVREGAGTWVSALPLQTATNRSAAVQGKGVMGEKPPYLGILGGSPVPFPWVPPGALPPAPPSSSWPGKHQSHGPRSGEWQPGVARGTRSPLHAGRGPPPRLPRGIVRRHPPCSPRGIRKTDMAMKSGVLLTH